MGCPALEGFDKMAESLATMATIDGHPLPSPVALQPSTGPPYVNYKMRIPSTPPPRVAHQPHITSAARHHKSLRLFRSLSHSHVRTSLPLSLSSDVVMTISLFRSLTQVRLLIELCVGQTVVRNDNRSFNLLDVSLDHFLKPSRPSFFHLCTMSALTDSALHELMTPRPEMTGVFYRY